MEVLDGAAVFGGVVGFLVDPAAPQDAYPGSGEDAHGVGVVLFLGAGTVLDRLINTSHQVLMTGSSYRPNKRPGRTTTTAGTEEPS